VLRWRLFIEEYGPTFHYLQGDKNTLADMLSRLSFSERQNSSPTAPQNPQDLYRNDDLFNPNNFEKYDPMDLHSNAYYSMATEQDDDLAHCFAQLPDQAGIPFVLDLQTIAQAQERDADLTQLKATHPLQYVDRLLAPDVQVCCYEKQPQDSLRIYLPDELLETAVRWYHLALSHIGSNRLYDTMSMHFYNPKLKATAEKLVTTCDTCQKQKLVGRGHGQTAP
jgi:hypothetical protein